MKKILSILLAFVGLSSACSQKQYEDVSVEQFAELIKSDHVFLLDVRTADEFAEGHIPGAVNIDVKRDAFLEQAKQQLPRDKTIAVYCRSGRRSANACDKLAAEGYKTVNLTGGILAWEAEQGYNN